MPNNQNKFKDPWFAIEFLLEANLKSKEGIDDVPEEFTERHLIKIKALTNELKHKIETTPFSKPKKWKHPSVVQLINESNGTDPIAEIQHRARQTVLYALERGWSGPPFDTIELAKILNIEISPNDSIPDARTVPLSGKKYRIEYNPFQKPTRLNFSVGHEIVHTFFSDCYEAIRNREEEPQKNRELEQLCNIGASELQLPYVIFPADANAINEITVEDLINLAKKYKSSLESLLIAFVQVVARPCAIMVSTFHADNTLITDYQKSSRSFSVAIPEGFTIPEDSRAYYCKLPGWTERETVQWNFMDRLHNIYYIGISSLRKENKPRIAVIITPNKSNEKLQHQRINIEFGDATKPRGKGMKIIAQVVNTSGGLGAGFGKALTKNYPVIADALKTWKQNKNEFKLGCSQSVQVANDIYVFQMLAQKGLFAKDGNIPLEYTSLQKCLADLREAAQTLSAVVFMPLIGAGQAKGNWEVIEGLIYSELINQGIKVNIYILPGSKPGNFTPRATLSLFKEETTWRKEK